MPECQIHGTAKLVTCFACWYRWCEGCDPAPSALCHRCHGRGESTAPFPFPYILDYHGNGCGGCNLRFDSVDAALAYAAERGATEATVSESGTFRPVRRVTRPDARFKWREDS